MDKKNVHNNQKGNIPELTQPMNIFGKTASFFIKNTKITIFLIIITLFWGVNSFSNLSRELSPEVVLPYGMVTTIYNGAAPKEVETLVTDKIEAKLDELEHVKNITSNSGFGYSSVMVEFETGINIDDMVQKMQEKVSSVQSELPEGTIAPMVSSIKTNNSPILVYNIGGEYDFIQLRNIAKDIKKEIEKIHGTSDVMIIGGLDREIKIKVNPEKLAIYGISLQDIKNAITSSDINFPGGNIELDKKNYNIRTVAKIEDPKEFETIIIKYVENSPLYLRDIAVVEDGYSELDAYSRLYKNVPSGAKNVENTIAIAIKKKDTADIINVTKEIKKVVAEGKGKFYPDNLKVEITGDMAKYVDDQLSSVIHDAGAGLIIVVIVLFIFIQLSESLIVAMVIPLTLLLTFGLMKITDMTLNTITLFSLILAVGMVVDDGIVIMQNIDRLKHLGVDSDTAAKAGTNQIAPAVFSSTITTLGSFFPLMLTSGIMGEYIKGIPLTVIYALSASFFVAITTTPALSAIFLKGDKQKQEEVNKKAKFIGKNASKVLGIALVVVLSIYAFMDTERPGFNPTLFSWLSAALFGGLMYYKLYVAKNNEDGESAMIAGYGRILSWIISSRKRRWNTIFVAVVAFTLSMSLIPLGILKIEMFTPDDYTKFSVNVEAQKGTNIETTKKVVEDIEKELFKIPEIKDFVSNIGITGIDTTKEFDTGSSAATPNIAAISVDLVEKKDRKKSSMQIAEEVRAIVKEIPGAKITVSETQSGPPSSNPIYIQFVSDDLDSLKQIADSTEEILSNMKEVQNIDNTMQEGDPEIQIKINKEKAAAYGLNSAMIAMEVRNVVNGLKATTFKKDKEEINVIVKPIAADLSRVEDLNKITFKSYAGSQIPLNQVVEIIPGKSYSAINHKNLKKIAVVSSGVTKDVNALELTQVIKDKIIKKGVPTDVEVIYGGETEELQNTFTDMFVNMIVAILIIFAVLVIQFNSFSQPAIILVSVPLAMIGVMPGLALMGCTFNFVAFIGVVALIGIVVKNGIILIDYINYLRDGGIEREEAVIRTGKARFIPVLATTITAVGGIIPMTLKADFFAPLGYTIIFGLLVSTMLTLVVVPIVYIMFDKKSKKVKGGRLNEN
ncbi:MAG TPA: hypothetical protein DEP72_04110 [Clostridiales bacterium]|nr:MAG: hypothetical protein A2Y18_04390 [Clostridiales bacterium GWD2_32_19]HCC07327.1 hypothetical protein [Clostridiales bacterium]